MRKLGGVRRLHAVVLMLTLSSYGCSGDRDGGDDDDLPPGDGGGLDGGDGDDDSGAFVDGGGLDGGDTGDAGDRSDATGPVCGATSCGIGQRCETTSGAPTCIDNACVDLRCGATEECAPAAGGGNVCKSIACTSDIACSEARHCDGTKCVDDACEPGAQRCNGQQVFQCTSNGGSDEMRFVCGGSAYFTSACQTSTAGAVGCTCEDDWDCPSFTACNAGRCEGTGVAPTCTLPALPFSQVLPSLEFRWGGESAGSKNATGRPFPNYAQVVTTPVVANLDDDNGDGLINELDFPEIVFLAYAGSDTGVHHSAAVRAVHGGGPKRGQDYFALCGTKHWPTVSLDDATCGVNDGSTRPGGALAVGDLDYDGVPEIVVPTEQGGIQILDNRGRPISEALMPGVPGFTPGNPSPWRYPQVALANLDNRGFAEIIVGNRVLTLEKPMGGVLQVRDIFVGPPSVSGQEPSIGAQGDNDREFGPMVCPANLVDADPNDSDVSLEIVAGSVVYALPAPPPNVTRLADCAAGDTSEFCQGRLSIVWDARVVNPTAPNNLPNREGFCAVADVLGANPAAAPGPSNPLDRAPEVILVSNGRLIILNGRTGQLLRKLDVEPGQRGGAPNIDDFDGDGFPEIAMASSGFYTVIDLQEPNAMFCPAWPTNLDAASPAPGSNPARNPGGACTSDAQCSAGSVCNTTVGSCVCLHNGWRRRTEDDSSKATSSSVFDFNGDGAAEVVYGDECYFRIYDGASGNVQLAIPSVSRTVLENPVVADVDNDGNAEIVFVNNNETLQCGQTTLTNPATPSSADAGVDAGPPTVARDALPNGFQVWGDARDTWVSARRIWNEHAYHVTNVTESGSIPLREPESWRPYGNRLYNTYRSQPRAFGVAPDLALSDMQISSPGTACGALSDQLNVVVLVKNLGDLRVGPGVVITFYGTFGGTTAAIKGADGMPLTHTLTASLEPDASALVQVMFRTQDNGNALPTRVAAIIDEPASAGEVGKERECREDNNRIERDVAGGAQLADLRLELGAASGACAATKVAARVFNDGSLAARDVLVRLYAGDPSSGGKVIGEATVAGPIEPGASLNVDVAIEDTGRDITVWGIADPLNAVEECNNANNVDEGPMVPCGPIYL